MQDIGIVTNRPASVVQTASSTSIVLTFRGTRDAPHVSDKDTRMRITLPIARAQELRRQLAQVLPTTEPLDWQPELLELLEAHRGEDRRRRECRRRPAPAQPALGGMRARSNYTSGRHPTGGSVSSARVLTLPRLRFTRTRVLIAILVVGGVLAVYALGYRVSPLWALIGVVSLFTLDTPAEQRRKATGEIASAICVRCGQMIGYGKRFERGPDGRVAHEVCPQPVGS